MAYRKHPETTAFGILEHRGLTVALISLVCFFLCHIVYDAVLATALEQLKRLLMIVPLLLVVAVHWLSSVPPARQFILPVPGSEPGWIHRAGGSPWGVSFLLLLLCFLISYQPDIFHLFRV